MVSTEHRRFGRPNKQCFLIIGVYTVVKNVIWETIQFWEVFWSVLGFILLPKRHQRVTQKRTWQGAVCFEILPERLRLCTGGPEAKKSIFHGFMTPRASADIKLFYVML